MTTATPAVAKRPTRIAGLDTMTAGGLPAAGGVLVLGEAGAGKTVFALQILAAARQAGEEGVFASFEESREQIQRDATSFDWGGDIAAMAPDDLLDARPPIDAGIAGGFDLDGLVAGIGARLATNGGRWLVLDGIDRLLTLQPEPAVAIEQIRRLNDWCEAESITLLLTGKRGSPGAATALHLEGIEFLLSTVLVLSADLVARRLNRRFRIAKYRGSAHVTDEVPMVMDDQGLHLPFADTGTVVSASTERVGSGIERLDRVLGGGLYRGSTTLVSGKPGTAKTTLAVAFARAAAERGETALYLSFDELADRIVRNVASVGLDLQPALDAGRLHIESREAWSGLIEEHYVAIQRLLDRLDPAYLVIDPISALLKANSAESAYMTIERILAGARARGITTLLTSLDADGAPDGESTLSHASTLADTWIALEYRIFAGERNRALSIVKSRGSAHSNQVRELLLSSAGPELADSYQYGSEVLMGTARLQKEHDEAAAQRRAREEHAQRQRGLERALEQARLRREEAQREADRLAEELAAQRQEAEAAEREDSGRQADIRRQRDPASSPRRGGPVDPGGEA